MDIRSAAKSFLYGNRTIALLRILLGAMFLYSGYFKVLDFASFARTIDLYGLVPGVIIPYVALTIPVLELILGLLLVSGYQVRPAAFISLLMMLVFSAAISINLAWGKTFDCGCFELGRFGISENISYRLVLRDLVMAAVFYLVFNAKRHFYSLENLIEKRRLRHV